MVLYHLIPWAVFLWCVLCLVVCESDQTHTQPGLQASNYKHSDGAKILKNLYLSSRFFTDVTILLLLLLLLLLLIIIIIIIVIISVGL
jgi:hypothetical protein